MAAGISSTTKRSQVEKSSKMGVRPGVTHQWRQTPKMIDADRKPRLHHPSISDMAYHGLALSTDGLYSLTFPLPQSRGYHLTPRPSLNNYERDTLALRILIALLAILFAFFAAPHAKPSDLASAVRVPSINVFPASYYQTDVQGDVCAFRCFKITIKGSQVLSAGRDLTINNPIPLIRELFGGLLEQCAKKTFRRRRYAG